MEKTKLIKMRKFKGYKQEYIAEQLNMAGSCYSRRENGEIKMNIVEWEKLAKILNVPLHEIYEPDENQVFICNNSSSVNYQGNNNSFTVPEALLASQQKYFAKLEEENNELKKLLNK